MWLSEFDWWCVTLSLTNLTGCWRDTETRSLPKMLDMGRYASVYYCREYCKSKGKEERVILQTPLISRCILQSQTPSSHPLCLTLHPCLPVHSIFPRSVSIYLLRLNSVTLFNNRLPDSWSSIWQSVFLRSQLRHIWRSWQIGMRQALQKGGRQNVWRSI